MKEFLLSDEQENSYRFVIRTSGINLSRFNKNPVMLFQHDRTQGVIGRWEGLRVDNGRLYGTPVFDDRHEPGKTVKEKVESGFLRGVSVGIEDVVFETIDGVNTAISCTLVEVSIVDIPANENATIQLYYNDRPVENLSTYMQLSINQNNMNKQELEQVFNALGLPANSTVQDAIRSINTLKNISPSEKGIREALSLSFKDGLISESERKFYESAFTGKPVELAAFLNERREERNRQKEKEYIEFVESHRENLEYFSPGFIQGDMKTLAMQNLKVFKDMVLQIEPVVRPSQLLAMGRKRTGEQETRRPKSEWTLQDYRKFAPQELKGNPKLYEELLNKEFDNINH